MSKQMNLCLYIERKVLDIRHMILQKISINHMINVCGIMVITLYI